MTQSVTLALPSKGAIYDPTMDFLSSCGLRIHKPNKRQYTGTIPLIPSLEVLFQRVKDVLYKVSDGTAQLGITGLDLVNEYPSKDVVVIHPKLGFGHCQLVVAVPEAWVDVETMADVIDVAQDMRERRQDNIRVATTYPSLTRKFMHSQGIHHFTLVKADGAIEAAPTLGYADIVVDLTQTGTTLRENHLKMIPDGVIVDSQACLIGNRNAFLDPSVLETTRVLLEYIDGAMQGKRFHQLTVNIQGMNAEDVAHKVASNTMTHGLQGPTVAPIYSVNGNPSNGQWYTVTLILKSRDLLPAVEYLRSIGGNQVSVSPLRYVFMKESPTFKALLDQLN